LPELRINGIEPDLFWYNPNIHPYTEYRARRDCLGAFAAEENLKLIMDDEYGLKGFISGMPSTGSRCAFCYRLRLEKTAKKAAEAGFTAFSTTLLISPYQNHEAIKTSGEECAACYGVDFFYMDLRPRFKESQNQARKRNYYMQKYCGCIFSEEERYLKANGTENKK
jgi:predicted adenine nucleotide alpha hydrolase (AANH) superfamily ATPase